MGVVNVSMDGWMGGYCMAGWERERDCMLVNDSYKNLTGFHVYLSIYSDYVTFQLPKY